MIGAKDARYPTVARHVKIDQDIPAATTTIPTISAVNAAAAFDLGGLGHARFISSVPRTRRKDSYLSY
jgi:hypothetical protein